MLGVSVPDHLRQIVRKKEAIMVVGAGVSISATSSAPFASWKGLLMSGIEHCRFFGQPKLADCDVEYFKEALKSNDADNWLGVATLIERKLKYPFSREWAKWLKETVGSLEIRDTNLIQAILDLELPIITTNYDNLFSQKQLSRRLHSIDWKSGFFDEYFLENPLEYIFHLHGSVLNPSSVVLGVSSYSEILNEKFVQNFTHLLSLYKGLVFVGYGSGFGDPNFSSLLEFISQNGSLHRHYILVKQDEADKFNKLSNIYPIPYGASYEDLPNFLRSLPFGIERYFFYRKMEYGEILDDFTVIQDMPHCPKTVIIPSGKYKKHDQEVIIKNRFAISECPITIREWDAFCSERGEKFRKFLGNQESRSLPIVGITYADGIQYCCWLSSITGHKYRLPTEIEWEFCALGGCETFFWWGNLPMTSYANFRSSNIGKTTPVKKYPQNPFRLYDILGNVWEWCEDKCRTTGGRILKGGCFYYEEKFLSPFQGLSLEDDVVFNSIGLRVVREVGLKVKDGDIVYINSLIGLHSLSRIDSLREVNLSAFSMRENQTWLIKKNTNSGFNIKHPTLDLFICSSEKQNDYDSIELRSEDEAKGRCEWSFKRTYGGYTIVLKNKPKALDIEGAQKKGDPRLITFQEHGNFNQVWNFLPA